PLMPTDLRVPRPTKLSSRVPSVDGLDAALQPHTSGQRVLRTPPCRHRIRSNGDSLARCAKRPTRRAMPTVCNCGPDKPPSWHLMNRQAASLSSCGTTPVGYYCSLRRSWLALGVP